MLAVALRQLGIDNIPLRLEHAAEDGIAGFLGDRFQLIQGCFGLQSSAISSWEVEGGEFGRLV